MNQQLNIAFPNYSFDMEKVKEAMLLADIMKLEKEVEHLRNSKRVHKGHYTKLKNKSNNKLNN